MISFSLMSPSPPALSQRKIFFFWLPLAATWLMMAVEGPFIAAVVARLPLATYNLAAFGVALSFALIAESPIIMLMSASTALVSGRNSYLSLRRFTWTLNVSITLAMGAGLYPPVFQWIAYDLIHLPELVGRLTYVASILFLPWPAAIGFRRFYQGILIRSHLTRRVAYGTVVRIVTMSTTALVLALNGVGGAYTGAAAASVGVVCEGVATRLMCLRVVRSLMRERAADSADQTLSGRTILRFYTPLAMTSLLALGVHPLVTFFLGKSRLALESLAVLPVVNSLVFVFRSIGLSFQEVGIALLGRNGEGYRSLRRFALTLFFAVIGGLSLIAFGPFAEIWFVSISGLNPYLARLAILPTQLLVVLPGLTVLIAFQRAVLVKVQRTGAIIRATAMEVVVLVLILYGLISRLEWVGIVAAAIAYTGGRLVAVLYLARRQNHQVRRLGLHGEL